MKKILSSVNEKNKYYFLELDFTMVYSIAQQNCGWKI